MSLPEDHAHQLLCHHPLNSCKHEIGCGALEDDDVTGKSPTDGVMDAGEGTTMGETPNNPQVYRNDQEICKEPAPVPQTCDCDRGALSCDDQNNLPGDELMGNKLNEFVNHPCVQDDCDLDTDARKKLENNVSTSPLVLENDELTKNNFLGSDDTTKEEIIPQGNFNSPKSFPVDESKDVWLCIPGKLKQITQPDFEPAGVFGVDRIKEQLLCRPAKGLGQHWFQLDIGGSTSCFHGQMNGVQINQDEAYQKIFKFDVSDLRRSQLIQTLPPHSSVLSVMELECNNSNGIQQSSTSSQVQDTSLAGRVIRVEGDGRCLFRSLVTCLSEDLQKVRRDDFGCALRRHDADFETHLADVLRAKVIRLMKDNSHFYGQLERGVLNADQPMPPGYRHFDERLHDMTLTSTMPGDLELNAVSTVLKKQVLVVDTKLKPIFIYGKERYPQSKMVTVRYTRLGPDVGHYDAVILDRVYEYDRSTTRPVGVGKDGDTAVCQSSMLDYFTGLFSKFNVSGEDDKSISGVDFGVQFPPENDLSRASNIVSNGSRTSRNVGKKDDEHFQLMDDQNTNKCYHSIATEPGNKIEYLDVDDGRTRDPDTPMETCDNEEKEKEKEEEGNEEGVADDDKEEDDIDTIEDTSLFSVTAMGANQAKRAKHHSINLSRDQGQTRIECEKRRPFPNMKKENYFHKNKSKPLGHKDGRIKKARRFHKSQKTNCRYSWQGMYTRKTRPSRPMKKIRSKSNQKHGRKLAKLRKASSRKSVVTSCRRKMANIRTDNRKQSKSGLDRQRLGPWSSRPKNIYKISGLNRFGCRSCYVCCQPIALTYHKLTVCILCGRPAHRQCIAPSRKKHGDPYSLCRYCVPE